MKPTKNKHGGARPGAGRPRKSPPPTVDPEAPVLTAQEYLERVVSGQEPPDAVRTRAALGLIRYQRPASRGPIPTPPASQLAKTAMRAQDEGISAEFTKKAAEIRARHARKKESK